MRAAMLQRFDKMHGLGNDFVVIDARAVPVEMSAERACALADRHTGIGCDQLILLEPSPRANARMRIFNPDGGEVEACGNASRAVARLLGMAATLETNGGDVVVSPDSDGATVEYPAPRFGWDEIPLAYAMDTTDMPVGWDGLENPSAVNVGNPHVVFFVADHDAVDLGSLGPVIETDPIFPERINVNVASVTGPNAVSLRVWERGAGITRACGTGACATAVAAIRSKRVASPVEVSLPGGVLTIAWAEGGPIRMSGTATHVFSGEFDWDSFPL